MMRLVVPRTRESSIMMTRFPATTSGTAWSLSLAMSSRWSFVGRMKLLPA